MIFKEKPEKFKTKFEVVACYLVCEDKIALLHRKNDKPQGGTWDTPGGKVHPPETIIDALIREVFEETGLRIEKHRIEKIGTYFVVYPEFDFVFHTSRYFFAQLPKITIQPAEHTEFRWVTPKEALTMNLIPDEDFCIKEAFPEYLQ